MIRSRLQQRPTSGSNREDRAGAGDARATELANAQELVRRHGRDMRFDHSAGQWLIWQGGRWSPDECGQVHLWAKQVAQATCFRLQAYVDERALARHVVRMESAAGVSGVMRLAQTESNIPITRNRLDRDPFLLNVHNGTVDLRAGELRPHRRDDLLSHQAPVRFDPRAGCPTFHAFLDRIMPPALQQYVRRVLGYCLTGDVRHQELYIFYGGGANGKSVLLDAVHGLMGSYAGIAAPGLLTASAANGHPTEIADLCGKHLVVASETEENAHLRIQLVKRLTGDATLKGRFMRQDFFEFPRTHKTILVTNNRPLIRETTNAIWRRIRLVPFEVTIPAAEQDPELLHKLAQERPGILAWLVTGCLEWQSHGFETPDEVRVATEQYEADQDPLADFVADRCIVGEGMRVPRQELHAAYQAWVTQTREPHPLEKNVLFERIRRLNGVTEGQPRAGGKPVRMFLGVGLAFGRSGASEGDR